MQRDKEVEGLIMQLSEYVDLLGLRTYIIKRTPKGKSSASDPWAHTRAALAQYAPSIDPEKVIELFRAAGCKDELAAVRWLLKHDDLVP